MQMEAHIEIYIDGRWETAATFEPFEHELERGTEGGCALEYIQEYAFAHLNDDTYALAPQFPANFDYYKLPHWPPFLLDLLPGGHARRRWLNQLDLPDNSSSELALLLNGGANPPGNLRIREAARAPVRGRRGFTLDEVAARQEGFIEYAEEMGALVSGASSVQGEAPKFLLVQDEYGDYHPDGALSDGEVARFCLVKYPRGRHPTDELILKTEALYYEVAQWFGLRVGEPLTYIEEGRGALFIPRFDRLVTEVGVVRHSMMSLAALTGAYRFGQKRAHEDYCRAIAAHSVRPAEDMGEYLRRDILNLALGNTDNHGRNTVLLKTPEGETTLAPLFDFAPMFMDREGVPRVTRWEGEKPGGPVDWQMVAGMLEELAPGDYMGALRDAGEKLVELPGFLRNLSVPGEVAGRCLPKIEAVAREVKR
jgi:serine/threonine-protein kinase HipA